MIDQKILDMVSKYVDVIAGLTDPPMLVTIYFREELGADGRVVSNDAAILLGGHPRAPGVEVAG